MAGSYTSTGTNSNLTRLELESLRRADYASGGKALTVGDSALLPEGVVGRGSLNAEPFATAAALTIEEVYGVRPPAFPGTMLGSTAQVSGLFAETVRWFGPTQVLDDTRGTPTSTTQWATNDNTVDFVLAGVQAGDLLLVLSVPTPSSGGHNTTATAVITSVAAGVLTCTAINRPLPGNYNTFHSTFEVDAVEYAYLIVRPSAVQLFALPGSGPVGREQSFLAFDPGSSLHSQPGPSLDVINSQRVTDLVSPVYAGASFADRADAVYASPAPRESLFKHGYRLVLYPDNGSGTGPDLTKPITSLNPVIDASIPASDQRISIDYKAGIVRLSCAPATGSDIKPSAGCVNATTGRLNLYAVYWAVDQTLTRGVSQGLWATRGVPGLPRAPGRIRYTGDEATPGWRVGQTGGGNDLYLSALDPADHHSAAVKMGLYDPTDVNTPARYFVYRPSATTPVSRRVWRFLTRPQVTNDAPRYYELEVGERTSVSVGDSSSPPTAPGLYNPAVSNLSQRGARYADDAIGRALSKVQEGQFTRISLKRGLHRLFQAVHVPPGVVIEGEGEGTVVRVPSDGGPAFTFGPNTTRGVWEAPDTATFNLPPSIRIEGMDIVWNPVSRVWGVVYADTVTNAIWFNEITLDGSLRLPGLGIDIKNTGTQLYTAQSPNAQDHTTGHYPRMAHCGGHNQYAVVWVEEKTVSLTTGPQVVLQGVKVNEPLDGEHLADEQTPEAPPVTVTVLYSPAASLADDLGVTWCNHPSIAVQDVSTPTVAIVCWGYTSVMSPYTTSALRSIWDLNDDAPGAAYVNATVYPPRYVISSTDVTADFFSQGVMYAWSVRPHSLLVGTQGKITGVAGTPPNPGSSYLTDAGLGDFATLGVEVGSKFLWLGATIPTNAPSSPSYYDAPATQGFDLATQPSYGDDGLIYGFDSSLTTRAQIKAGFTGRPYNRFSSVVLKVGAVSMTASATTVTDSGASFITQGVVVGDFLAITSGSNTGNYEITARTATTLTVTPAFPNTTSGGYVVYMGRPFRFAIAPRSFIQGVRDLGFGGQEQGLKTLVGVDTIPAGTDYLFGEVEPDFVRLGASEQGFLLVYQSMNTTGRLAKDYMQGDTPQDWSSTPRDQRLYLRDTVAPYREHVTTAVLPLFNDGSPIDPPFDTIPTTMGDFDEARARPMVQLGRSIGTRALIGTRPNYRELSGTGKDGQNMADQVSLLNWAHRWTPTHGPSLLPDITWTGQDFVIVSPTKHETRSYVGNYRVDVSTGIAYLYDATFYFGLDDVGVGSAMPTSFRGTLSGGDLLYFPAYNVTATVASVVASHGVALYEADSALLNAGSGAALTNIEWVLIRGGGAQHGPKKPGYRVDAQGNVLTAASFITFAEERADDASLPATTTLMMRGGGADRFGDGGWSTNGVNFPATLAHDPPTPAAWSADIGFRGPVVGSSVGTSALQPSESSTVAVAWGEVNYAAIDRELAGGSGQSVINQVVVRRQSFGPYKNGLANMAIQGHTLDSQQGSPGALFVGKAVRVHTRHGDPVASQGFFATDGYRNCFVFAGRRNHLDAISLSTFTGVNTTENYPFHVYAVYTDALGLDPLQVNGPTAILKADTPSPVAVQDAPFAQEFTAQSDLMLYPNLAAAPRTVWDGHNFAAVWWETIKSTATRASHLRFCLFPGDGHDSQPQSELVAPSDSMAKIRGVQDVNISSYMAAASIGSVDLATSGRTYAAVWTQGLDQVTTGTPLVNSAVGVTLFTPSANGNDRQYDHVPTPYYAGFGGFSTPGYLGTTQDQDYKVAYFQAAASLANVAQSGDILVISNTAAMGHYRILRVSGAILYVDRWVPAATGVSFTLHRYRNSSGAKTYLLDSSYDRQGLGQPKIIWDGQHYVMAWWSKGGAQSQGGNASQLMIARLREDGVSGPSTVVASSTQNFAGSFSMLPELNSVSPTRLYFAGYALTGVTSGSGTTGATIAQPSGNPWTTQGVLPGCVISFGPSGNKQLYTAISVTSSTLTVDRTLHVTGAQPTTPYGWVPMPRVKPGDLFMNGNRQYDTNGGPGVGSLEILLVDPTTHTVLLDTGLVSTVGVDSAVVFGRIIDQSSGDPSATGNLSNQASDGAPLATALMPHHQGRATWQDIHQIGRVHDLTFNPETNLYVALVSNTNQSSTNRISLVSFDRQTTSAQKVVPVSNGVSTHFVSALGFNGQHYVVVWANQANGDLYYAAYDARLRTVSAPQLLALASSFIGTNVGQVPGDSARSASIGTAIRRIRNVQVRWNDTLCQWMVSFSLVTYQDGGSYFPTGTQQVAPELRLTSTTVSSGSGNRFQFNHGGTNETNAITPGSKLVFRYDFVASSGQVEAVAEVLDINYTYDSTHAEVVLNTAVLPRSAMAYIAGDISVAPREDVFLVPLTYASPAIQLVDPDGVTLRDLTLTGGVDIEERWKYIGRPFWRSSGHLYGAVRRLRALPAQSGIPAGDTASIAQKPKWLFTLAMPTRLSGLTTSGIRSRTRAMHRPLSLRNRGKA